MPEDEPVATFTFEASLWYWRGPAPFYFLRVPEDQAGELADIAAGVTYGWGMVPAQVTIGRFTWETSLWPKDGGYLVPVRALVRRSLDLDTDDVVAVQLTVAPRAGRQVDPRTMAPRRQGVTEVGTGEPPTRRGASPG